MKPKPLTKEQKAELARYHAAVEREWTSLSEQRLRALREQALHCCEDARWHRLTAIDLLAERTGLLRSNADRLVSDAIRSVAAVSDDE